MFESCDDPGIIPFRSPENEEDFVANMSDANLRRMHHVLAYEITDPPSILRTQAESAVYRPCLTDEAGPNGEA